MFVLIMKDLLNRWQQQFQGKGNRSVIRAFNGCFDFHGLPVWSELSRGAVVVHNYYYPQMSDPFEAEKADDAAIKGNRLVAFRSEFGFKDFSTKTSCGGQYIYPPSSTLSSSTFYHQDTLGEGHIVIVPSFLAYL